VVLVRPRWWRRHATNSVWMDLEVPFLEQDIVSIHLYKFFNCLKAQILKVLQSKQFYEIIQRFSGLVEWFLNGSYPKSIRKFFHIDWSFTDQFKNLETNMFSLDLYIQVFLRLIVSFYSQYRCGGRRTDRWRCARGKLMCCTVAISLCAPWGGEA